MTQPTITATVASRLEALPLGAKLDRLVIRISAGGWFEFYDLFMTAYIALGMIRHGLFSATGSNVSSIAGFTAAGFGGMFAGTLVFGWISDSFGRKTTFVWSLVFYSIMTLAMALAPNSLLIDAFRLLAGIGIGVQIVTIDAYISEIAPAGSRGRLIALSQAITYTAVPVVAYIAYVCVPASIAGLEGWRFVALLGGVGAILVWPIAAGITESPRWLESRGRMAEARAALLRLEQQTGEHVATSAGDSVPASSREGDLTWWRIWSAAYRSRTAMLVAFNIFQTIGFYGFASWVPLLLYQGGVAFVRSLEYTFIIALVTPLGPLLAMRFADRWERKWQIVTLAVASSIFGLLLAHARVALAIIACGALITLANTWFSSAFHAYQAELYPTSIRAAAVGFVYSWSRLSSVFVGYLLALVLKMSGAPAAFDTIAIAMVISATIVAIFGPLTNRRQIEVLAP